MRTERTVESAWTVEAAESVRTARTAECVGTVMDHRALKLVLIKLCSPNEEFPGPKKEAPMSPKDQVLNGHLCFVTRFV